MQRKEAVRLVNRALSFICLVCALYETTCLPERLLSYLHYSHELRSTVGFLLLRTAIYLALAGAFWKCTPWVERTHLPGRES